MMVDADDATPRFVSSGTWNTERGTNAVAAMEDRFYAGLLEILELDPAATPDRGDPASWPQLRTLIADAIASRPRDEWIRRAGGRACVSAVLDPREAWADPHNVARGTFVDVAGVTQPVPQPRFSRTPTAVAQPPPVPGEHTRAALQAWGIGADTIDAWLRSGAVRQTCDQGDNQ